MTQLMQRLIASGFGCALFGSLILMAGPAVAQPAGDSHGGLLQLAQAAAPTGQQPAAQPAPQAGSNEQLRKRIEQLEEQLVDMQVVIGTLESLARSGGGGASAAPAFSGGSGYGGGDSARLNGLETQVRALAAQLQQLTSEVRNMGAPDRRGSVMDDQGTQFASQRTTVQFGSTTITEESSDAIGGFLSADQQPPASPASQMAATEAPQSQLPIGAAGGADNPKQLYETAYGYLMQRNYGAAEAGFSDFLQKFPNDSLAGNAQYWLGEAYFVRGEYKSAAGAFLKGYREYASNARAPDSLLKLAMSLDRMGQKDAACSSYAELSKRFPNASGKVKNQATQERQRLGCS